MAKKQNTSTKKKSISKADWISKYMDYVLENEKHPKTVYKFTKEQKAKEEDFYKHFGSFQALREEIWHQFYQKSIDLLEKSPETANFGSREKLLTFYFTFFEMLSLNRSYVLFVLQEEKDKLKSLAQLKVLRKDIKGFAKTLIQEDNEEKQTKILQKNESIFSEATWVQTMFLLKFWMDDNSAEFEKTDVAIEKSVNTVFDVFDNTPLDRVLDLGKFLYKERMA